MSSIIFVLFTVMNLAGLLLMKADKKRARKNRFRIKEKTLWLTAICGGAIGAWAGMHLFRHKTKHAQFKIGLPLLAIAEAVIYLYFIKWSYHFSFFDKL